MAYDFAQLVIVLLIMTPLVVLLGKWLARVFTVPSHGLAERWTYGALGVEQHHSELLG